MSRISVIIPVYNVAPYLRQCLDSVINQTLTDLEIICVNDGSTDNSLEILNEYATRDSRIKIVNKKNGGLNSARNEGLQQVSSPYFIIVDADDWIDVSLCKKTLHTAEETDADMTHFFFKCIDFPDRTEPPLSAISYNQTSDTLEKIKLIAYNWSTCWSILWKTEFVRKNNLLFDESLKSATEIPFTFLAAALSNYCAVFHEALYFYRYRATSMVNDKNSSRFLDRPKAFLVLRNQLSAYNIPEKCITYLLYIKCESLYSTYKDIIQPRFAAQYRKALRQHIWTGELEAIKSGKISLTDYKRDFFVSTYDTFLGKSVFKIRLFKRRFCDSLARMLASHSPWIQNMTSNIENLQNENLRLKKIIHDNTENIDNNTGL